MSAILRALCCIWIFVGDVSTVLAQDVVGVDELVDRLAVKSLEQPRTRGVRTISVNVASPGQGRVSLNSIQFEHDSAEITRESEAQLRALGEALANANLVHDLFVIEGHADAFGEETYNKALSFRRALAVKEYLVKSMGVDHRRLEAVGMGEEKPKTADPYDPVNRRVDIVNAKSYK